MGNHRPQHTKNIFRRPRQGTAIKTPKPRLSQLLKIIIMKKLFFLAILATTLCFYLACNETTKDELAPGTPATTEVVDNSGEAEGNLNLQVSSRAPDCTVGGTVECPCECCCVLLLVGPTGTSVPLEICGVDITCTDNITTCTYGGGCSVNTNTNGSGFNVTLILNGTPTTNDRVIFCSGDIGEVFQIYNPNNFVVRYVIACAGTVGSGIITLQPFETAMIVKGEDCDIDPNPPCTF